MIGYPGAKGGAGVYQAILNAMPPHRTYVEAFVGSGQILLRKKPAEASIVIDADPAVAAHWSTIAARAELAGLIVMRGDCRSIIADLGAALDRSTLIYCDPPYVRSTRRSGARIFRHEFTDQDHRELLLLLRRVPAQVMLSGYRCALYDELLADWRRIDYRATTRRGQVIESLWCNFAAPAALHDYSHLGADFRERERIKRKKSRWRRRLAAMPELERRAIMDVLLELATPAAASAPVPDPLAAAGGARGRSAATGAGGDEDRTTRRAGARSRTTDDGERRPGSLALSMACSLAAPGAV